MSTELALLITDVSERLAGQIEEHGNALKRIAETLDMLRNRLSDTPLPEESKQAKHALTDLLDKTADSCELAVMALKHGTLDAGDMANEIYDAMLLRLYPIANNTDVDSTKKHLRERANNIAAGYAGRVLKDIK